MPNNIDDLYTQLTEQGAEGLGTQQQFREYMQSADNTKSLHAQLTEQGVEGLGTPDQFEAYIAKGRQSPWTVGAKSTPSKKPKSNGMITQSIYGDQYTAKKNYQQGYEPQPQAVPASLYRPDEQQSKLVQGLQAQQNAFNYQQQNTPLQHTKEAAQRQKEAMQAPAFPDMEAPQLSRSIADDRQKYKGMMTQNIQKAVNAGSNTAVSDAVQQTYKELARQGYDVEALGKSGFMAEGIENVLAPTAEAAVTKGNKLIDQVFDDAKIRAAKARSEQTRYTGMGGAGSAAASRLIGEIAYNKEIDPDKLQAQLTESLDKNALRETFAEVQAQAEKYGIDPTEYFNSYVAPRLREKASKALDKFMVDQYMPKDDMEYVLSGFSDSITGMLTDWLTKTAKQNAYKQQALSEYGKDAGTGTKIAREAVGLVASTPEFMVSGGVASAATKKIFGRAITDMVARGFTEAQARNILAAELSHRFGQRVASNILQHAVSGAANFATLDAMSEAARGVRDDDFDIGNVLGKAASGAGKGMVFGTVGGAYAGATAELTGAKKVISNLLGVPVNGAALTASSNAMNYLNMALGGEDELATELGKDGEMHHKPLLEQWAENSLTDLMMRATNHRNFNLITSDGRREIAARIRDTFSGRSESQKLMGKAWQAGGLDERAQARLKAITKCDNLRDALSYGAPGAADKAPLPYSADMVKSKSQSLDEILSAERQRVMEQNWDNIINDRGLTAKDKMALAAMMGARYQPNPTVTITTVKDANGNQYVEYRDAAGCLNERVPLHDADLSLEAQNKIRLTNIMSKVYALGDTGKGVIIANAMRYAMKPDAQGKEPSEEQKQQRMKEYVDRYLKQELSDMEITELSADLDKATTLYDGADKIKVIKDSDGTASVQYSKNGTPIRTDHYATEEEANQKAAADMFAQELDITNMVERPKDLQAYYEGMNGLQEGAIEEAIKGYSPDKMEEVRDRMLSGGATRVDFVTGADGRIRTAEQDELVHRYISWIKELKEPKAAQEVAITRNDERKTPTFDESYKDPHSIDLTENAETTDDGKPVEGAVYQTGSTQAEKYNIETGKPVQAHSAAQTGREEERRRSEGEAKEGSNNQIGRSLTKEESNTFVTEMESHAEVAPEIELNIENWDKLFGEDGKVSTPIGEVKMGENQFAKLMRKGRDSKLGMVKPTLENPDVIIEDPSKAIEGDTAERDSSYIFIKAFRKADGSRYYYFTSITVSKQGKEVVVSNQEKNRNKVLRLLTEGNVIWRTPKDATTSSAEGQGLDYAQPLEAETATKGSGITPQTISSDGKVTNNLSSEQENSVKSSANAYATGKNAIETGNFAQVADISDNYELAMRRVVELVRSEIVTDVKNLTQTQRHDEAHALVEASDLPAEQKEALHMYIDADAAADGVNDVEYQMAQQQVQAVEASIRAKAGKDGNVTIIMLYSGKKAHVVDGNVNDINGTIMIRELDEQENPVGEPRQIAVKQIKKVEPRGKADDLIFNERKRIQQEVDAYYNQQETAAILATGRTVALKDDEGHIIMATVVGENADGTINFQTETGDGMAIPRTEAMRMAEEGREEGFAMTLQAEAQAREEARKQAQAQQQAQAEAEAQRRAEEEAARAEQERLKDPRNRLKRTDGGKIDYTNSNPDDVEEYLAKHGANGRKAAEQELAKVAKAIEQAESEAGKTEEIDGVDALLMADEQAAEQGARLEELNRQKAFWEDQISRIDRREEAARREAERRAAEKRKAEKAEARRQAAYNKPINDARKRMADDPDAMDILSDDNREPRTLEEYVADNIPQKGLVLKNYIDGAGVEHLGLEGELGINHSDMKKLMPFIGKAENGATDITTLAERIWEDMPESIRTQAPDADRDIRDMIINIMSEARQADDIIHFVDNARIREAEAVYRRNEEYERAKAEHEEAMKEEETAPEWGAEHDPFAGAGGEAPFSIANANRHNEQARREGGLILDEKSMPLDKNTRDIMQIVARQLGITIDVKSEEELGEGIEGQTNSAKSISVASWVAQDREAYLRYVIGHELTHAMKKGDKEVRGVWKEFVDLVKTAMGDEKFKEEFDSYRERYDKEYKKRDMQLLSDDDITEEVVCNFVGDEVFQNREFVNELVTRVEKSHKDAASIVKRMRDLISKVLDYLRSITNPTSAEKRQIEALQRARDIWADMYELTAARQREREGTYNSANTGDKVQYSIDNDVTNKGETKNPVSRGAQYYIEAEKRKEEYKSSSSNDLFNSLSKEKENSYGRAMEIARRILSGEATFSRIDPKDRRRTNEACLIAASIVGRGTSQDFDRKIRSANNNKTRTQIEADQAIRNALISFAEEGKVLVEETHDGLGEYMLSLNGTPLIEPGIKWTGAESLVYDSTDPKYVIKDTLARGADSNNLTIADRLEGMLLWNSMFPEAQYELIGFKKDGNLIVKQPFIKGSTLSTAINPKTGKEYTYQERNEMLDKFISEYYGLRREGDVYTDDFYTIDDVATNHTNVLIDEDGRLYIVDGFVRHSSKDILDEIERNQNNFEDTQEQTNTETKELSDTQIKFSIRRKPEPEKKGIGYKVFYRGKDGKLYPPMVANPNGADTPIGVWLDADAAPIANQTKTGRNQVKQGGKGTQGGSGFLSYRPGWHLGEIPYALQFNRKDANGEKTLFPKDFVWAEVEYAADKDYQEEATQAGMSENGKYRHAYAGLQRLPEDGFYKYRTNPNPETDPWIITGAMKVNRVLSREEVEDLVRKAGREPQKVEGDEEGIVSDYQSREEAYKIWHGLIKKYGDVYRNPDMTPEDIAMRDQASAVILGKSPEIQKVVEVKEPTGYDALSAEGKARNVIYCNPTLIAARKRIQNTAKMFNGQIGDASAGAFNYKKEGSDDMIHGVADSEKAGVIGRAMKYDLNQYKDALIKVRDKGAQTKARLRVFDEAIADVDKAIKWYKEFAEGQHQRLGDHDGIKFSVSKKEKEDKTLMGVHNISEDKLKKALKLGGLANPSLAVIDTNKGAHTSYGEISLIPKSSLIDAETGRNSGTYLGDAWTPTYPGVHKFFTDKGEAHKMAIAREAAGGDENMADHIASNIHRFMEDDSDSLHFLFLRQKGLNPEIKHPRTNHSHEEFEKIQQIFGEGTNTMPSSGVTDEQNKALLDLMMEKYNEKVQARVSTIEDEAQRENAARVMLDVYRQSITDKDGKVSFAKGNEFVYDNWRDERRCNRNEIDWYGTDLNARDQVKEQGLQKEYDEWKEKLLEDEDVEEKLFAGWTRDGNKRYLPNTLENASRLMNRESQTNAYDSNGLGATKSALLKRVETLDEIRKNKGKLQDEKTVDEKMKEASDELFEIIHQLADMQKIDDNPYSNIDAAEHRLQEALVKRNPVKYLNDEYGYRIDAKGEYAQQIKDFIKSVGKLPAKYFETKFRRPVGLDEFAVAVVPETTSKEVIDGLKAAGLDVRTYDGTDENRKDVTMEAVNKRDDVKFSLNRSDRIYDKRKLDPKKLESAKVLVDEIKGKYMGSIIPENDVRPFVDALKDVAEIVPKKEILNNENYKDVFGEGVESPIGHVKMSDNQMNKMLEKGRQGRLYFAYRTLRCPDLILQKPSKAKEGQETERPYSYLYVKTFANEDGTETTFYYSVTVQKDGLEISMSNYDPKEKQVIREIKENKLAYINEVTLPSEPDNSAQGNQLANPVGDSFESKGSDNFANSKANANISANQEENSQEVQSQDVKFSVKPTKDADGNTEFSYEGDPKFSIRVFHGSAADFDKFDHKFMGSGEGNQVFGWGTYVTSVEEIGRHYAETAKYKAESRRNDLHPYLTHNGKRIEAPEIGHFNHIFPILRSGSTEEILALAMESSVEDNPIKWLESVEKMLQAPMYYHSKNDYLPNIAKAKEEYTTNKKEWKKVYPRGKKVYKHIYEVDIPDDHGNYITWNEHLSNSEVLYICEKIKEYVKTNGIETYGFYLQDMEDDAKAGYPVSGMSLYQNLADYLPSDRAASEALSELGYTGIKVPTNYLSGGNKEGTYNYVIFDENDAQIVNNTKFSINRGDTFEDVVRKATELRKAAKERKDLQETRNKIQTAIAAAEAETNTEPTEAQKEAGNYKKGHFKIDGYDVTIENPKGSERSGTDASGKKWSITMNNTYGYIRGTEGVDGDHIDVFLSDDPTHGDVFVVDQVNDDGSFDEHKVMYGFPDIESARKAYLANYSEGWQGLGAITPVSKEEFKKWINSSHRKTKPFAKYSSVETLGDVMTENTAFSIRVPEGKTMAQMQAETDADIARQMNVIREDDTFDDVVRKGKALREASETEKLEQTIADNQIKPGDSFEDVLRKAQALKAASGEQVKFAISKAERARRAYEREKKRQQKEIDNAQKELRKKVVDEINFLMNDKLLSVFNRSTLSRMLKDVQNANANNLEETLISARTEINRLTDKSQQRQLSELMKLKTQDQNGKGMSIAKNVSDSVRRVMEMIQGRVVDLKATGYEEDMTQLRRQNIFINGENKRLEDQIRVLGWDREKLIKEAEANGTEPDKDALELIDSNIRFKEDKIKDNLSKKEKNLAELAELKTLKQEAEAAKAQNTDYDVQQEIDKLNKKMDDHVEGKATWTTSDSEKLTGLQIIKGKVEIDNIRRDIADLEGKLADLEETLASYKREARRPQRYVPVQRMEQLEQQIQSMKQCIEFAQQDVIRRNGELIDTVKGLIEEGKDSLYNQVEAEKNRKYDLLHNMLGDIVGTNSIPTDKNKEKEQQTENKMKKLFSAQLHSFEYMAKRINENTLGEDGWFYNRFVKGKDGVMEAENNYQRGVRAAVDALDAKAQEIYGYDFATVSEKSSKIDHHPKVFLQHDRAGMVIKEEIPLSKSQAMYLYMVWKMPDGRMKLMNDGFTEETMSEVREFLDKEDMQFADWIQDEFLSNLRARYNDLYVELYHTSMANIENYVPLKIMETDPQKDSNLADDANRSRTLEERAGALINRKFNLHRVDYTSGAFNIIADHVNKMEEWHAFARVRKDLDYILSNTYVRKQLNANSSGRFNQLYDAAAIAAHAYRADPAKYMDDVVGWLTKGLVGGNIAHRYTTAIKQTLSVPAFYGYSMDPKYLAILTKNIGVQYLGNAPAVIANMMSLGFTGKAGFKLADKGKRKSLLTKNMMWCMENMPTFRARVLKGTAGLNYMDEKLGSTVGKWVDKYLDYGMATNQMIDAITCSIGIKSIFDYKYGKLSKAIEADTSLSPEEKAEKLAEAKRMALMDADIYYNATQQSNHAAFLSPMQMSRSMIDRALSVYQNASIGYSRRAVTAAQNLWKMSTPAKYRRLQSEYMRKYMNEDPELTLEQARKKANWYLAGQAVLNAITVALHGYALNWLWDWGGRGLLGFFQGDDDEKEKRLREEAGLDKSTWLNVSDIAAMLAEQSSYPLRGLTGVNMATAIVNGTIKHPLLFWDQTNELVQRGQRYFMEEDYAGLTSEVLYQGLRTAGFDARVWYNIVTGTVFLLKAATDNNQDRDAMIGLMFALNTPNSNRRQVAEELYKDYDRDTYVRNIMNAAKFTDSKYKALMPGVKLLTEKNVMEIYKEFELNHLPDEEFRKLKSVQKELLKHYKSIDELQEAYDKEQDPNLKQAIGKKLIQVMEAEQPEKAPTSEQLIKKARESLMVKDVKNPVYIRMSNYNDAIEDQMLKDLKAEYKPVWEEYDEMYDESPMAAKEFYKQNKAIIDKYEDIKADMKDIASLKKDLETIQDEDSLRKTMEEIRTVRAKALGKQPEGQKK